MQLDGLAREIKDWWIQACAQAIILRGALCDCELLSKQNVLLHLVFIVQLFSRPLFLSAIPIRLTISFQ